MEQRNPLDAFDETPVANAGKTSNPLDAFDAPSASAPPRRSAAQAPAPPVGSSSSTSAPVQVDPEVEKLQQMSPAFRYPLLAARGAAKAVPGSTDAGAAIQAGLTYLGLNYPDVQSSGPFSERFASARRKQEAIDRAAERSFPATTFGSQVAASLAIPIAGPAGRIGSVVEPLVGAGAARAVGLGSVGGLYGGASGLGEGGNLDERLESAKKGAVFGGIGGALVPPIVDIAGAVGSKIANKAAGLVPFRGAANEAQSKFLQGMQSAGRYGGGLTKEEAEAAVSSGQPILPIDLGGAVLSQQAKTATHANPEALAIMRPIMERRNAEQQGRLYDFMSGLVGKDLTDASVADQIRTAARTVNTPAYATAMQRGASGVWSPALERISNHPWVRQAIPQAVDEANANAAANNLPTIKSPFVVAKDGSVVPRLDANGNPIRPTLEFWDIVKKNLDGRIRAAESTPTSRGDPNTVRIGNSITKALTKELDAAVPEYASARAGAGRYLGEESAYRFGQKFLSSTKAADINAGIAQIRNFSPEELGYAQHSYMAERAQKFMNLLKSRDVGKATLSPAQKAKDVAILGKDKADELEAYLLREKVMHNSFTRLFGSDTAPNHISALKHLVGSKSGAMAGAITGAGEGVWEGGLDPETMIKRAAIGAVAGALVGHRVAKSEQVALEFAKRLVSEDPAVWQAAVKAISRDPKAMVALRRAEAAVPVLGTNMKEISGRTEPKALPAPQSRPALPPPQKKERRKARATGGRTGPKAQTAQSLISAVERAKKAVQQQTESILSQPDEHVVAALSVANKHI